MTPGRFIVLFGNTQRFYLDHGVGAGDVIGDSPLARWLLVWDDAGDTAPLGVQLARLVHSARVELFELDATSVGGDVLRFHAGLNGLMQPVLWQGHLYTPYPVQVTGFARTHDGPMPRPTLRAANIDGSLGALIREFRGLKGATLRRKRTLARYLDAANFADGNPGADPASHMPDDVYSLDRIVGRDSTAVEYELASVLDVQGVMLPRRVVLHSVCMWRYRSTDCGYTGPAVATANDVPTSVLAEDACSHRLSGCRMRAWPGNELPFGGFPGVGVLRNG